MKTKSIAIVTRTFNRPEYFKRCRDSVEKNNLGDNHYVLYQDIQDESYLNGYQVKKKFIDQSTLKNEEKMDKTEALHNLHFNEIYSDIKQDWIYHLDDDNILFENAFEPFADILESDADVIICRYKLELKNRIIPSKPLFRQKIIKVNHIDTLCFLIKTDFAKTIKWDGYRAGDFRFIKKAVDSSQCTEWVDRIVGCRDYYGGGEALDLN